MEMIGCIQRIGAQASDLDGNTVVLRSIKYVQEPNAGARIAFRNFGSKDAEALQNQNEATDAECDDEVLESELQLDSLYENRRILPQWSVDQPLYNQIFAMIDNAGQEGVSTMVNINCVSSELQLAHSCNRNWQTSLLVAFGTGH